MSHCHDETIQFTPEFWEWEIRVASAVGRSVTDPDGQTVTVRDTVLRATRRR